MLYTNFLKATFYEIIMEDKSMATIESIINGKLDEVIFPLISHDQAEKLNSIQ